MINLAPTATPLIATLLLAIALVGCSNPKEANESNFEAALNARLERNPFCLPLPSMTDDKKYLFTLNLSEARDTKLAASQNMQRLEPYMSLVTSDILSVSDINFEQRSWGSSRRVKAKGFNLTDKGNSFLKPLEETKADIGDKIDGAPQRREICFGRGKVLEIGGFTEPADMMGYRVSRVSFTYHVPDMADWAKTPALQSYNGNIKLLLAEKVENQAYLVLTDKGWVHEKDMRE